MDATHLKEGLMRFHRNFKGKFLEDSVLWYCIDLNIDSYLSLDIHDRINFKGSYFEYHGF